MTIRVAAVTSQEMGARFIRWGLGEAASHLALVFDGTVIESTLTGGVHETARATFLAGHDLIDSVVMPTLSFDSEERVYKETAARVLGRSYDRPDFMAFCVAAAKRKFLGIPFPGALAADKADRFICVEVLYGFLEAWAIVVGKTITLDKRTFGVMSPLDCVHLVGKAIA